MLLTPAGTLVTAAGTGDLSLCKAEACFEHFDQFSESSACSGVCMPFISHFLSDFLLSFADSLFFLAGTNKSSVTKQNFLASAMW